MSWNPAAPSAPLAPRAALCGAVTATLGVAAHVLAGGEAPGAAGALVVGSVTVALMALGLRGRASRARVLTAVLASQVAVHVLLAVSAAASAPTTLSGGGHDMGMGDMTVSAGVSWHLVSHHLLAGLSGPSGILMTAAHLAAAVLLGVWLAAGDQVLCTLLHLSRVPRTVRALRAAALVLRVRLAGEAWRQALVTRRRRTVAPTRPDPLVVSSVGRRGPPARVCVVPA